MGDSEPERLADATRRAAIKQLRAEADGLDGCPVCRINAEQMAEEHRREVERLRGALTMIAGQANTIRRHVDGGSTLVLDADDKMRQIAREALK